jgi:hypothetical protein
VRARPGSSREFPIERQYRVTSHVRMCG